MDSVMIRNAASAMATTPARAEQSGKVLPGAGNSLPGTPAPAATPERVAEALSRIQSYLSASRRELQISMDEGSGRTVVRVVNPETQEIIRQIPTEEVLKLASLLRDRGGGILSELA
ncbi:MAG: flagellar protein FlaG [Gammaproteobacteria bacterium]|jgi:flagellar protein FlaG|nr:flagellar protein FlaG [Gammaproteobacteria bacterium]